MPKDKKGIRKSTKVHSQMKVTGKKKVESLMKELLSDDELELSFVKEDPLIGLKIQGRSKEIEEVELNVMIEEDTNINSRTILDLNRSNQTHYCQGAIVNNKKVNAAEMQIKDGRTKEDNEPFSIPAENGASEDILSRHDRILKHDMLEVVKIKKKLLELNRKKNYILHERILPVVKRDLEYKKMIYGEDYIGYNNERMNFITRLYNGDKYRAKAFLKKHFKKK